jgi:hypothetical protein
VAVAGEVGAAGEEEEARGGARHGRDLIGYACSSAFPRAEVREESGGERCLGRREEAAPRDRTRTGATWRFASSLLGAACRCHGAGAGPLTSCQATAPAPVSKTGRSPSKSYLWQTLFNALSIGCRRGTREMRVVGQARLVSTCGVSGCGVS